MMNTEGMNSIVVFYSFLGWKESRGIHIPINSKIDVDVGDCF